MRKYKAMTLKTRPNKMRLQLDIDAKIYDGILRIIQMRYCTITKWVTRAIVEKLQKEESFLK